MQLCTPSAVAFPRARPRVTLDPRKMSDLEDEDRMAGYAAFSPTWCSCYFYEGPQCDINMHCILRRTCLMASLAEHIPVRALTEIIVAMEGYNHANQSEFAMWDNDGLHVLQVKHRCVACARPLNGPFVLTIDAQRCTGRWVKDAVVLDTAVLRFRGRKLTITNSRKRFTVRHCIQEDEDGEHADPGPYIDFTEVRNPSTDYVTRCVKLHCSSERYALADRTLYVDDDMWARFLWLCTNA
jgi:hypothetical protein